MHPVRLASRHQHHQSATGNPGNCRPEELVEYDELQTAVGGLSRTDSSELRDDGLGLSQSWRVPSPSSGGRWPRSMGEGLAASVLQKVPNAISPGLPRPKLTGAI
jgi:hypothetical protein